MSIQSISIPSYATRTAPSRHVVFNIAVSTQGRSYHVARRYSDFADLDAQLRAEVGPPPVALPPKTPKVAAFLSLGSRELTPQQLAERREGLERWLRSLLAARDGRWAATTAFVDFLAAPDEKSAATGTAWLHAHAAAETLARGVQDALLQRDRQVLAGDRGSHATHARAKRALAELVSAVQALDADAAADVSAGEAHRRRGLVSALKDRVTTLSGMLASQPRLPRAAAAARAAEAAAENNTAARAALLAPSSTSHPAAPGRVLGKPQETTQTRALDNTGLMQMQQHYMEEQDDRLDALALSLRRQREMGTMISDELTLQDELMNRIEAGTERVTTKLGQGQRMMKKL